MDTKKIEKINTNSKVNKAKAEIHRVLDPVTELINYEIAYSDLFDPNTEVGKYILSIKSDEKRKNKIWDLIMLGALKRHNVERFKTEVYLKLRNQARILKSADYINNPYYKDIKIKKDTRIGNYLLTTNSFIQGELMYYDTGDIIEANVSVPKIGIWQDNFEYPIIAEGRNAWMTITPNEIHTMEKEIDKAHGKVLTYGLGLGYFAYMASLKDNVESVAIVEKSEQIIELFEQEILPQFRTKAKIKIIKADMFEHLKQVKSNEFDYCFIDIWQECNDIYLYFQSRKAVKESLIDCETDYWISGAIEQILIDEVMFQYMEKLLNDLTKTDIHYEGINGSKEILRLINKILDDSNIWELDINKDILNNRKFIVDNIVNNMEN